MAAWENTAKLCMDLDSDFSRREKSKGNPIPQGGTCRHAWSYSCPKDALRLLEDEVLFGGGGGGGLVGCRTEIRFSSDTERRSHHLQKKKKDESSWASNPSVHGWNGAVLESRTGNRNVHVCSGIGAFISRINIDNRFASLVKLKCSNVKHGSSFCWWGRQRED